MMSPQTKHKIKCLLGSAAERVLPGVAREVDGGKATGSHLRVKNWIVYSRLARAQSGGDTSSMSAAHFDFWKSDTGNAFYEQYTYRYDEWFLKHHAVLVDKLAEACAQTAGYQRFLEIGCGDGRVIQYCKQKLPSTFEFVGLDINPTIVRRNKKNPSLDSSIEFVHDNAADWLGKNPKAGTVLFSYGGVLEYFSQEKFLELLATLGNNGPAMIGIVEPFDPHHDLDQQTDSYPFGRENSFSHHHGYLLEQAGYSSLFAKEMLVGDVRWMVMLAQKLGEEATDDAQAL